MAFANWSLRSPATMWRAPLHIRRSLHAARVRGIPWRAPPAPVPRSAPRAHQQRRDRHAGRGRSGCALRASAPRGSTASACRDAIRSVAAPGRPNGSADHGGRARSAVQVLAHAFFVPAPRCERRAGRSPGCGRDSRRRAAAATIEPNPSCAVRAHEALRPWRHLEIDPRRDVDQHQRGEHRAAPAAAGPPSPAARRCRRARRRPRPARTPLRSASVVGQHAARRRRNRRSC